MFDLVGKTVGSYRIIEQIGAGGMATVYKAYQPNMDRYVAIKILPMQLANDPEFTKRFQREARAIARLEHAHILPVYDYGEYEGVTFIAMRYIEAGTLRDRMSAGSLGIEEINRIIGQIGSALDYAHRMSVIHRDVKPANVLIDNQGDIYLSDFGLARMMEPSQQLTASGVGLGTPSYMSPEQGQGIKVDHRSDIYSLGIILYEMLTGRVPYEAETPMAVVLKHITGDLPLPHTINPNIPEVVERVILKALAKDPNDRYQTTGEMIQALNAAFRTMTANAQEKTIAVVEKVKPTKQDVSIVTRLQRLWDRPRGRLLLTSGTLTVILLLGFLMLQLPGNITILTPNATAQNTAVTETQTGATTVSSLPAAQTATPLAFSIQSLATPTSSVNGIVFVRDDFDNPVYDGSYNREVWQPFGDIANVFQEAGILNISLGQRGGTGLMPASYNQLMFNSPFYVEARMMINPSQIGHSFILVGAQGLGEYADCGLGWQGNDSAEISCNYVVSTGKRSGYSTNAIYVDYGTWHTTRIEVQSPEMEFRYFVDGLQIGTYTPPNIDELKQTNVDIQIGFNKNNSLSETYSAFIDYVEIGPSESTPVATATEISSESKIVIDDSRECGEALTWEKANRMNSENPEYAYAGDLAIEIKKSFSSVDIIDTQPVSTEKLKNARVLLILSNCDGYSSEEIKAIEKFVRDGGRLLILGSLDNFLLSQFGIRYLGTPVELNGADYDWEAQFPVNSNDPILKGIPDLPMHSATALEAQDPSTVILWSPNNAFLDANTNRIQESSEKTGPFPVIMKMKYGEGYVVVFANRPIWTFGYSNNYVFVLNALQWLIDQ